jgi:hypothetical protein
MAKQVKTDMVGIKFSEREVKRLAKLAEDKHLPLATFLRTLIYQALESSNGQAA